VEPHPLDLSSDIGILREGLDGVLEGRKGIAVDGGAGRLVNQLIQTVALAAVGELGPALEI
jgi:hypothetical protein